MIDITVLQQTLVLSLILFAPVLLVSVVSGLLVALLQSWLRVDDFVLPQLARVAAVAALVYLGFDYFIQEVSEYSQTIWGNSEFYF